MPSTKSKIGAAGLEIRNGPSLIPDDIDPSAGGGYAANIGSELWRNNGGTAEKWRKTGAGNTDWVKVSSGSGSLEDGYQNTFMGKSAGSDIPDYTSENIITDGDSLEEACGKLDAEAGYSLSFMGKSAGNSMPDYDNTNVVADNDSLVTAIGKLDADVPYVNAFIGKGAVGNELPSYSSTFVVANSDDLEAAIGKLDTKVGAVVTPQVRSNNQLVNTEAIRKHIDDLDSAIGPDSVVTNENYWSKAEQLLKNLSDLDGQMKTNVDNIAALTTGMNWYKETPVVMTDDASLRAASNGTTLASILDAGSQVGYFDDDAAPTQLPIGFFSDGDLLVSRDNGTDTHKVFRVYDDAGTLKVTTAGVDQLVENDVFFVQFDLTSDPDTSETVTVIRHNGSDLVFLIRILIAAAQAVRLSVGYAASAGNILASDDLETCIAKLDGNIDNIGSILTGTANYAQSNIHMGTYTQENSTEIPKRITDNEDIKQNIQDLLNVVDRLGIEINDTLAATVEKVVDTITLSAIHRYKWDITVWSTADDTDATAAEITCLAHKDSVTVDLSDDNWEDIGTPPNVVIDADKNGNDLRLKLTSDVNAGVRIVRRKVL